MLLHLRCLHHHIVHLRIMLYSLYQIIVQDIIGLRLARWQLGQRRWSDRPGCRRMRLVG